MAGNYDFLTAFSHFTLPASVCKSLTAVGLLPSDPLVVAFRVTANLDVAQAARESFGRAIRC